MMNLRSSFRHAFLVVLALGAVAIPDQSLASYDEDPETRRAVQITFVSIAVAGGIASGIGNSLALANDRPPGAWLPVGVVFGILNGVTGVVGILSEDTGEQVAGVALAALGAADLVLALAAKLNTYQGPVIVRAALPTRTGALAPGLQLSWDF